MNRGRDIIQGVGTRRLQFPLLAEFSKYKPKYCLVFFKICPQRFYISIHPVAHFMVTPIFSCTLLYTPQVLYGLIMRSLWKVTDPGSNHFNIRRKVDSGELLHRGMLQLLGYYVEVADCTTTIMFLNKSAAAHCGCTDNFSFPNELHSQHTWTWGHLICRSQMALSNIQPYTKMIHSF